METILATRDRVVCESSRDAMMLVALQTDSLQLDYDEAVSQYDHLPSLLREFVSMRLHADSRDKPFVVQLSSDLWGSDGMMTRYADVAVEHQTGSDCDFVLYHNFVARTTTYPIAIPTRRPFPTLLVPRHVRLLLAYDPPEIHRQVGCPIVSQHYTYATSAAPPHGPTPPHSDASATNEATAHAKHNGENDDEQKDAAEN